MPTSMPNTSAVAHLLSSEIGPAPMAKADLRKADVVDLRPQIGLCIKRARLARGWNLDEFAQALPAPDGSETRDQRQVARWEDGKERAQFDVLFGCRDEAFLCQLLQQLAPLSSRRVRVRTTIEIEGYAGPERRTA